MVGVTHERQGTQAQYGDKSLGDGFNNKRTPRKVNLREARIGRSIRVSSPMSKRIDDLLAVTLCSRKKAKS